MAATKTSGRKPVAAAPEKTEEQRSEAYLDASIAGKHGVRTDRTYNSEQPVAAIVVVPEENYRWGSKENMERDLGLVDDHNDQGAVASFQKLCDSIAKVGVQEPVGLVPRADGLHIVFGFTRVVAAQRIGLQTIPAFVYDASLPDAELETLQMLENATELKRRVNWVAEMETFYALKARVLMRFGTGQEGATKAAAHVARILGVSVTTMRNRQHWVKQVDKRVSDLARAGNLSCPALQEFMPGASAKFSAEFVTEVLAACKLDDGSYPVPMTPEYVRNAIRKVRIRAANRPAMCEGGVGAAVGVSGRSKSSYKGAVSPGVVRDVAVLFCRRWLLQAKLGLRSDADAVERITNTAEWQFVRGMGCGIGECTMPPVLEQVEGERMDDADIRLVQAAHERDCDLYAFKQWIAAFVQNELFRYGIRDIGARDGSSWMVGKTLLDGQEIRHREAYNDAIRKAAEDDRVGGMLAKAKAAWAAIRPLVRGTIKPAA